MFSDLDQFVFFLAQDVEGRFIGLIDEERDFFIDLHGGLGANHSGAIGIFFDGDVAQWTHAKFADHAARNVGDVFDILAGAGGDIAKDDFFGGTPTHGTGHFGEQFGTTHEITVFAGGLDGDGAWNGAHDDSMANFVIGDDGFLSLGNHAALAFGSGHDAQDSLIEFRLADNALAAPGGE